MKLKRSPGSAVTMMHITEDTPPDMLAGAMDLTVHLPTGRSVKMSVERSTPMMDLLVQIVTAHQLQLSGHIIQALEMAPSAGISDRVLPYKPNTPIGALDTQHIKVVPKNRSIPVSKSLSSGHQPFESTFRLKVHLPRNQLYVTRVSQNVYLEDIMNKVCKEKDLDPSKYEFRHPGNLDEVLDPKLTLSDYQITEIYVVSKGTGRLAQAFSTSDIMALRKEEERKQFQAKTGGGVFNLIFKRGKANPGNGSISSDNRSISPSHSDDSRSVTPPGIQPPPIIKEPPPSDRPKPPQRKRRPAPKPPQIPQPEVKIDKPPSQISNSSNHSDASAKKAENGLLICHSRNSSDSSGYHEASILSDNCNTSLPRRPKTMIETEDVNQSKLSGEHSRSTGNLTKSSVQYKSTSSLALHGRKKKAAPPPPPTLSTTPKPETSIIKSEITSPVVASQPVESLPESVSTIPTNQTPPDSISSSALPTSTSASATQSARASLSNTNNTCSEKISQPKAEDPLNSPPLSPQKTDITEEVKETEMSAILSESKNEADSGICEKEDLELETVWQYQLPSPPKAFRDASPAIPTTISHYDTETLPDSVVTNPELFEKLQYVKDIQDTESDIPSVISDEEKEICNKLTLEHLEKRKSLVYNRELATSLKFAQNNGTSEKNTFSTMKSSVLHELDDIITNTNNNINDNSNNNDNKEDISNAATKTPDTFKTVTLDRSMPNFQISSYDIKKEKINIFEDDTVRSNSNISRSNSNLSTVVNKIENITSSDSSHNVSNLHKTEGDIADNVSSRKNSESVCESHTSAKEEEGLFKKPLEVGAYRLKNSFYDKTRNINANLNNGNVNRSGSFSVNSEAWTPLVPVKRSKSQIALNKYKEEHADDNKKEGLSKSNSLLDVSSSLQSLEVMKKIQNKLSNSKEELDIKAEDARVCSEEHKTVESKPAAVKPAPPPTNTTPWTPPSINLGTWSERPKTQVTLKEDTDYKFSTKVNTPSNHENDKSEMSTSKSTSTFATYKPNPVSINNSNPSSNGVSIKVNGSEAICPQKSGNVVIKIGGGNDSSKEINNSSSRFINHITPEGYRKPLGNVNKIERVRPHSIAFDNQFDISRVPVVRSVELKKPFKDLHNKSITQIYTNNIKINDDEPKSLNSYSFAGEIRNTIKHSNAFPSNESINKPVFRNNSFTPVVKGFRTESNASVNRKVWSVYGTLPTKPSDNQNELNTNRNVPFSQMNLRRTESNKVFNSNTQNNNSNNNVFNNVVLRGGNFKTAIKDNSINVEEKTVPSPPPPPQLPKENVAKLQRPPERVAAADPRAELLSAIRNFGGKKGLRASNG